MGSPVPKSRAALFPSMWVLLFSAVLAFGIVAAGQDTGWLNPSQDFGDFVFGWRAYYDDNQSALIWAYWDELSHIFWGYEFPLPSGAVIRGIEVRIDAWSWRPGWEQPLSLRVQLSWDGGSSWTHTYETGPLPFSETTVILGGPMDGWGRTWRREELNPTDFRVRLFAYGMGRLDWVAVRVYFAGGLSLSLDPATVNLGTLTLDDYERGYRDWDGTQWIKLSAYNSWALYISATSSIWSYTGDLPDPKKPCGHLLWRVLPNVSGGISRFQANFTPLSTSEVEVASGPAGDALLPITFRLLVDYDTTVPGTYTLDFRYTLVVP